LRIAQTTSDNDMTTSDNDIPSWFTSMRGGSTASPSAEPEVAPLDGTMQSLYLPGLLDISIHRPNAVSLYKRAYFFHMQ
jgi:hypothetical protein